MADSTKKGLSKYSDDVFNWRVALDNLTLETHINADLTIIWNWCIRWRVTINLSKTKYMIFSKNSSTTLNIRFQPHFPPLEAVQTKRALGIIIDNKLSFKDHINTIAANAKKSSNVLATFHSLNTQSLCNLYKAIIRPKMEYGSIIWGYKVNFSNNRAVLETAQRHSLKAILKAPPTTPTSAMEAELNICPIDIRLLELQRLESIRILRKPANDFTKFTLMAPTHYSSPCHYLNNILKPLTLALTNKYKNYDLEPEPILTKASPWTLPKLTVHNLDLSLGNSRNRTDEQKLQGQQIIYDQINTCSNTEFLGFTDGSALNNPGPAGAAAVILKSGPNSPSITIGESLSHTDSFEAELKAILLFSIFCLKTITQYHTAIKIFIDCRAAIHSISATEASTNYHTLTNQIRETLFQIQDTFDIPIHIFWIPSHSKINHNDAADKWAKHYAKISKQLGLTKNNLVTVENVRSINKEVSNHLWNKRWTLTLDDCTYKLHIQDLSHKLEIPGFTRIPHTIQKDLIKLRIGHTYLPAHHAIFADNVSPLCDICNVKFNIDHLFYDCIRYSTYRPTLLKQVSELLRTEGQIEDTPTIGTLLGFNNSLSEPTRQEICKKVVGYLSSISYKV